MIVLHANDPAQVVSAKSFEVLLGEPARRVIVFSGLAKPDIRVNHDSQAYLNEVLVKLGVVVFGLEEATVDVGLACIENDETAFEFDLRSAVVEVDPSTGELQLRVLTALMGEETWLHQFSYQIVAHVMKVAARISGVVRFPREILDLGHRAPGTHGTLVRVTANRVESLPAPPGSFPFERLTPVATATIAAPEIGHDESFLPYAIDGCPFNIPLRIVCELGPEAARTGSAAVQVAGPNPVVLTNVNPEANGVDFAVIRPVIR